MLASETTLASTSAEVSEKDAADGANGGKGGGVEGNGGEGGSGNGADGDGGDDVGESGRSGEGRGSREKESAESEVNGEDASDEASDEGENVEGENEEVRAANEDAGDESGENGEEQSDDGEDGEDDRHEGAGDGEDESDQEAGDGEDEDEGDDGDEEEEEADEPAVDGGKILAPGNMTSKPIARRANQTPTVPTPAATPSRAPLGQDRATPRRHRSPRILAPMIECETFEWTAEQVSRRRAQALVGAAPTSGIDWADVLDRARECPRRRRFAHSRQVCRAKPFRDVRAAGDSHTDHGLQGSESDRRGHSRGN